MLVLMFGLELGETELFEFVGFRKLFLFGLWVCFHEFGFLVFRLLVGCLGFV